MDDILQGLNSRNKEKRSLFLKEIGKKIRSGELQADKTLEMNNHVHTCYSFSPYTPSAAAYMAWKAGLQAVGSMDHDSISAAKEMVEACRNLGIGVTTGFEIRVSFKDTPFSEKKINNPDSIGIAYIAIHGVPADKVEETAVFIGRINSERNKRNKKETALLNSIIIKSGIEEIDFQKDIYEKSAASEGGSITERHLLFAFSEKIIKKTGKGKDCIKFLKEKLKVDISETAAGLLADKDNPHYIYDLLGALKGAFLSRFFIQPEDAECVPVREVTAFAEKIGAIPAYAYLGDVTSSVTGDKKAEKFEDDFLDDLIPELKNLGFKAVTYMPPRNTLKQLKRVQQLCKDNELMEISGVDINSSRQSFNCPILTQPEFRHLLDAAWALIAHERLSDGNKQFGLFNKDNPLMEKSFLERINIYSEIGKLTDPAFPEKIMDPESYLRRRA